jgi:hypothetical protein
MVQAATLAHPRNGGGQRTKPGKAYAGLAVADGMVSWEADSAALLVEMPCASEARSRDDPATRGAPKKWNSASRGSPMGHRQSFLSRMLTVFVIVGFFVFLAMYILLQNLLREFRRA